MSSPFISTLSYHGINISIVGNRSQKSDVINDPSFIKEVIVGENGELIVGIEDIKDGRIILSIPKQSKTSKADDIFEKLAQPSPEKKGDVYSQIEAQTVDVSPFINDSTSKRQRKDDSNNVKVAEVSPQDDVDEEEPKPKKQMARQSVKKKISLSSEVDKTSPHTISRSPSKTDKEPAARWGHTMTKVSNNRLVLYGGQSEEDQTTGEDETVGNLFVYEPEEGRWVEPENCESIPRVWHTCTALPDMNLMVTFGGERSIAGNLEFLDDIMVLDTEIFLWYPPAVSGKSPTPRAGHSAALVVKQDKTPELVVFGGTRGRKWESSLHVLNCHRWEWSRPKVSGKHPCARSYHSATSIHQGQAMAIFGGNDGDTCFNDVVLLSSTSSLEASAWSWSRPPVSGDVPKPRTGHSACLLQDGKTLLIHGGWDPSDSDKEIEYFDDAYTLNTDTWEWRAAPQSFSDQVRGGGITGHVMEVVSTESGQKVAMFGGQCVDGERINDMTIASL